MSKQPNHKNLITALLIVAIVTIFGYVAYLAVYNVRVLNEIQSNLTQGEAAKGGGGGNNIGVPILASISPTSTPVGSPGITLTANGSNFARNAPERGSPLEWLVPHNHRQVVNHPYSCRLKHPPSEPRHS